jgi:predicted amidohydrolase
MFLAACVQLRSTSDAERCLDTAERLIRRAAGYGATLVATPEATTYLGPHDRKVQLAEPVDGPTHRRLGELAAELGIHLLIGSGAERAEGEPGRCHNTSLLFDPEGALVASYRKMHLFDVDIPGGVRFSESKTCAPGDEVVVAETALGRLGMSICYDLRFPEMYRAMVDRGAEILTVPSAFTLMTGKDHWHALLRARAIETQCYVLAPGQWGEHDDKGLRRSYGHSVIIDPWGIVVGECSDGEGICLAEIDLERVRDVRRSMPLQSHRRL